MSAAALEAERLRRLADVMLPAAHGMPSAGDVSAIAAYLERVLAWRDDLRAPLARAVADLDPESFTVERLAAYHGIDEEAYVALTTVVAACYYLSPVVRERIGYPGQVAKTYDAFAYTAWVAEGLLDPVMERGPIYREAP
ncbi:MAG: hypothetical protein OXG47_02645 [bacterium]|nr:hypothetical protein [bacterium]MCY3925830.1 hypothetical protein [bacterium]